MVHDTVPFMSHFTLPPTPITAMLHFRTVPGKKSLRELVRHREEQLSIAISFESESKAVVCPMEAAAMQVMAMSLMLLADRLFPAMLRRLVDDGE
jgi:hypothetical protein